MTKRLNIGIIGCCGRMGRENILEVNRARDRFNLRGAVARRGAFEVGSSVSNALGIECFSDVIVMSSVSEIAHEVDVLVEFVGSTGFSEVLGEAVKHKLPIVSGTTGVDESLLSEAAGSIPVFWSSNMSVGVNVLKLLVRRAAAMLGEDYDAEILELHHSGKKDSPSGTSMSLGRAVAAGKGVDFEPEVYGFSSSISRAKDSIGFAVSRGGGVVGDHSVMFIGKKDMLELKHRAMDRSIYSRGAMRAAEWLCAKQQPGLYGFGDVYEEVWSSDQYAGS